MVYLNVEMSFNLSKIVHVSVKLFDFANPLHMMTSYIYSFRHNKSYIVDPKDGI